MTPQERWGTAFMVRHGERYFVNNGVGDLIIARFTPQGYVEIDRTHLIDPTNEVGTSRAWIRTVNWSHPALRQPAHRAPQRPRDHPRLAGGGRLLSRGPAGLGHYRAAEPRAAKQRYS